jgi:putative ABC transport system ATP-binding protein
MLLTLDETLQARQSSAREGTATRPSAGNPETKVATRAKPGSAPIASAAKSKGAKRILEAQGIVKVLGDGPNRIKVLKGVDIELRPGELTLLMGPSGSGKTTLLSILGCILTPTEGHLSIAGQSTAGLSADGLADLRRRHIGFVFQSYNLFPTLTATQNILLAMDLRGSNTADAGKATKALEAVGLGHRANALPGRLSGGEKQRVAIARALACSPSVILADEPTAALDSENGKGVMALLAEVAKDTSRAVLAVTHDHRTLSYADRIIRIEDGQIVAEECFNGSAHGSSGHGDEGKRSERPAGAGRRPSRKRSG